MIRKTKNFELEDENGIICNFVPEISSVYEEVDNRGKIWFSLTLRQIKCSQTVGPFRYSEIGKFRFEEISPCYLCMNESDQQTDHQVWQYIRRRISEQVQKGKTGVIFCRIGWHHVRESNIYVAGNRILGNVGADTYCISPEVHNISFPSCPECNAKTIKNFLQVIANDPDVLIPIISNTLRIVLITPFYEAGYPLRHVMYIIGKQGLGKTTTVKKFALLFDRNDDTSMPFGMVDAGSTPSSLKQILNQFCDVPAVLDDICISTDTQSQRKRLSTASNVIRYAANESEFCRTIGRKTENLRCKMGLFITGEIPLESPSDITRCAIVAVTKQMESYSSDDRALMVSVVSGFLTYFSNHYEALVSKIKYTITSCNIENSNCPRQQQIFAELKLCFSLFLDFAEEFGTISGDKRKKWERRAKESNNIAFTQNMILLEEHENRNITNPEKIILQAIDDGALKIAKNRERFAEDPDKFAGYRHKGDFCIKLNEIGLLFSHVSGTEWTVNRTGRFLRSKGLVDENGEHRTAGCKAPDIPRTVRLNIQKGS